MTIAWLLAGALFGAFTTLAWQRTRAATLAGSRDRVTRRATAESEDWYRQLAESSGEIVALGDRDGTVRYLSQSVEKVTGYAPEDIVGSHMRGQLVHPDDLPLVTAALQSVFNGATPLFVWRCRRRSGGWVWLETHAVLARPDDTSQPQILSVSRNVERRTAAEASLREVETTMRALIDRAAHGIFRASTDGRFFDVNPALARMLGYEEPAHVVGVSLPGEVLCDPLERATWVDDAAQDRMSEWYDQTWRRADGSLMRVRLAVRTARDAYGHVRHVEAIAENVTERLQREEVVRRADRMASLGRTLAGVGHELNNPLAAIAGFTQILLRQSRPPDEQRALETILSQSRRAARVVKDLATIARRQEVEHREPVDVNAVVSYIADTQRYANYARGIAIDVMLATEEPRVLGDPAQLEQVILHLMVNARQALELRLSHSPSPSDASQPLISLRTTVTPSQVRVEIVDTGTGIAPTDLAHIWDPFWTSREEGEGSGLGLSVVNSIVVSHGGAIAVKSEVDRGSHFVITLPRMDATDTGGGTGPVTAGTETKARQPLDILVVDDEPVLRDLLTRFFSERGHAVLSAEGGDAALRLASQVAFDVVICDFHMPGLDGCQVVHRLRALHAARSTRYFLASGDTLLSASTLEAGVDAVIDKPYNMDEVLALVESTGGAAPSRESA